MRFAGTMRVPPAASDLLTTNATRPRPIAGGGNNRTAAVMMAARHNSMASHLGNGRAASNVATVQRLTAPSRSWLAIY
jgi:hypothetical protein